MSHDPCPHASFFLGATQAGPQPGAPGQPQHDVRLISTEGTQVQEALLPDSSLRTALPSLQGPELAHLPQVPHTVRSLPCTRTHQSLWRKALSRVEGAGCVWDPCSQRAVGSRSGGLTLYKALYSPCSGL